MKKGQAAMEFLMTYGWAILVVLAAIGALAYFGVLSPGKLVPDRCTISPGFDIKDCKVSPSGVDISLYNGLGADVTNVDVSITSATSTAVSCTAGVDADASNAVGLLANAAPSAIITLCAAEFAAANGGAGPNLGERFDADLTLVYTKTGESVNHTVTGKIQRKVEQ